MKNFKSLSEQVGDKITRQLENYVKSRSTEPFAFQPVSAQPVNASTGKNYKGLNAIWLSMQGMDDPRWVTQLQARKNGWEIDKSAKPVLITFTSYSERIPIKGEDGKNIRDENGKVRYERVTRPEPITENAWVFNASQVKGMPPLMEFLRKQPDQGGIGPEQAERWLTSSGAGFDEGNKNSYDPDRDRIILLKGQNYHSNETMHAALLKQLAHLTGHETRLNRDMSDRPGTAAFAAENLRGLLTSMLFSTELNIPYGFEMDKADAKHLISHIKNVPNAVQSAIDDAKKVVTYIKDLEQQRLQKKPEVKLVLKTPDFALSEQIPYKDKVYEVKRIYKNGRVEIQDQSTNQKIKMDKADGLYNNLLEAKKNAALQVSLATAPGVKADSSIPLIPNEQQLTAGVKIKR